MSEELARRRVREALAVTAAAARLARLWWAFFVRIF